MGKLNRRSIFRMSALLLALCVGVCLNLAALDAMAFSGIVKNGGRFLQYLAELGKSKGSQAVMKELEVGAGPLKGLARMEYIRGNLAKVLVVQGRISKIEADEWVRNLGKTPGFEKTLSKMAGASSEKYVGHKFELEVGNALAKKGISIREIGKRFDDGLKGGATDIDLLAQKGGKQFAIEIKNYDAYKFDFEHVNTIINDMESLRKFHDGNASTIPLVIIKNKPAKQELFDLVNGNGAKRNIKVLWGEPGIVAKQFDMLKNN